MCVIHSNINLHIQTYIHTLFHHKRVFVKECACARTLVTTPHCDTMQQAATHCDYSRARAHARASQTPFLCHKHTLQHNATRYNTLQLFTCARVRTRVRKGVCASVSLCVCMCFVCDNCDHTMLVCLLQCVAVYCSVLQGVAVC